MEGKCAVCKREFTAQDLQCYVNECEHRFHKNCIVRYQELSLPDWKTHCAFHEECKNGMCEIIDVPTACPGAACTAEFAKWIFVCPEASTLPTDNAKFKMTFK